MHPRNTYSSLPDLLELARRYPPLRSYVFLADTGPTIDFKSAAAQRRLTEALLYLDFSITLTLPDDRLCPPVPNRLDYILWIQDIVKTFASNGEVVRGIDIGTGASAICALLACRLEPKWSFVATDIDKESLVSAQQNVERNGFSNRITIVDTSSNGSILQTLEDAFAVPFHFTLCTPPFYASMEEFTQSAMVKEYGPSAGCIGSENEMVTPGGEVSFVSRMFAESLHYRMRCRWYTSKVASTPSLPLIVDMFREHQVDNYAITDFTQGETRRWAVAWSFGTIRLPDSLARVVDPTLQSIMPSRTTLYQQATNARSSELLYDKLLQVLGAIEGAHVNPERTEVPSVLVTATEITWSRPAPRMDMDMTHPISQKTSGGSMILRCRITCADGSYPISEEQQITGLHLVYQWIDGSDRGVFEGFVCHVNHEITAVDSGP